MNKKLKIFTIFSICIFIIFIAINFKVEKLIFLGKNKHEDSQNKTHVDYVVLWREFRRALSERV